MKEEEKLSIIYVKVIVNAKIKIRQHALIFPPG